MLLLAIISLDISAQQSERTYSSHTIKGNILELQVSDGIYRIVPYSQHILETSFIPTGELFSEKSHAVILEPKNVAMTLDDQEDRLSWSSEGIAVTITKEPFNISYSYKGKPLIAEGAGYSQSDSMEILEFRLESNEVLYGGGARALGMNRRGNLLELYNKAHYGYEEESKLMNYTMPLVLSSKKYMIHFDNAPIGWLDLDSKGDNTLAYHTISGRKTYQVVAGETWPDIMDQYTQLTGRQPMPPRWAFGNFSSRFGYHSERETRQVVDLFQKDSIPLDAVVIDIYWFGAEIFDHMGNLEFLADSFPTPYEMMADFEKLGVKTILVTEPFILTTSKRWKEAKKNDILAKNSKGKPYTYDFYFGNTGIIDIYDKKAFNWFWDIYKYYTEKGVAGWWGDLGEPEVHPKGVIHATGSADEVHNIYGHDWARLVYEGYQKDFPGQRPFILMRAGYSGSQRFGLIPWSGDVSRSWGGLVPQTEIALQMGMQGLAYMHSDLGGFAEGKVFDPVLYTRWLQYGIFQPLFRPHAQEHIAAEPVFHDAHTRSLAKKAIQLRYKMLPYNYTLAFENHFTGMPMMRPLLFEEPNNDKTFELCETYLWGDAFLVSPVVDSGTVAKEVFFPATGNWIDFYSGEYYKGGQSLTLPLHEDHIPVFVRTGSFIPTVEPLQSTSKYNTENLTVNYYFDRSVPLSSYRMYDDDGMTPQSYENGKYEFIDFKAALHKDTIKITTASLPGDNYTAPDRKIKLLIHHLPKQAEIVRINGQQVDVTWDSESKTLSIPLLMNGSEEVRCEIELPNPKK